MSEADARVRNLVFIESNVPDIQTLLAGLEPGTAAYVLDPAGDGLSQIEQILAAGGDDSLASISIVGHGAPGEVDLGATTLNAADVSAEGALLQGIGAALAPGGELQLFSCDTAAGANGAAFIDAVSQAAGGVDVVASTGLVGCASAGGSWSLDASTGALALDQPFSAQAEQSYQGTLASAAFKFDGVNYVADVYGSFQDANNLTSLRSENINAVAITADFGINAVNKTVYDNAVSGGYTESDDAISSTISKAVGMGVQVLYRPLIDFLASNDGAYYQGDWRANFNPGAAGSAGANAFFASYQTMIVAQAKLAQSAGATIFSIGAELDQITGPAYKSYWTSIISAVRAVFSGSLTYGAIWDDSASPWQWGGSGLSAGTGNITTQVSFWSQLDYVGIDEYAPISNLANPTVAQLIQGWISAPSDDLVSSITGGASLMSYYEGIAAAIGKPLLFTEYGYANSSDAAINPANPGYDINGNADGASSDPTLQANLYTAFVDAWTQYGNGSLAGAYAWNWEPSGANSGNVWDIVGTSAESALAAAYGSPGSIVFGATPSTVTASGTVTNGATYDRSLSGFVAGDRLDITGLTYAAGASATLSSSQLEVTSGGVSEYFSLTGSFATQYSVVNDGSGGAEVEALACFARGTRILTARGDIAVEDLQVGETVVTATGGARPVVWIGWRALDIRRHRAPAEVWPVRVSAHAFGPGLPRRDLLLSPGHNVAWEGVLMPIAALTNGLSIAQVPCDRVEYWHVELDRHDLLVTEGLASESYLDCGNRRDFINGGAFVEAHPDFRAKHWAETCLPLVTQGPLVAAARARLIERLVGAGYERTSQPDAHILADEERFEPISFGPTRFGLALPAGRREITLNSRTFVPAEMRPESRDMRALGLCVARLQIDGADASLVDESCAQGWHEAEYDAGRFARRWTTGETALPAGARIVIVDLAGEGEYWREALDTAHARDRMGCFGSGGYRRG